MDLGNVSSNNVIYIKGVTSPGSELNLRSGDVIQARVISVSHDNVVLRIGDARISAISNVPLERGSIVSLTVSEIGSNRIVLKQLNNMQNTRIELEFSKEDLVERFLEMAGVNRSESKNAVMSIANLLKGKQIEIGSVFNELVAQLEEYIATETVSKNALSLSTALNNAIVNSTDSGRIFTNLRAIVDALQHENSMITSLPNRSDSSDAFRDLKSLLLEMRESINGRSMSVVGHTQEKEFAGLLGSIEKTVQNLGAVGLANIPLSSNSNGFFYIPIPIYCGDYIGTAEIRIYEKEKNSSEKVSGESSFTVGFALQMPNLGSTQAFLEINDGMIGLSMALENLDAVEAAGELSGSLADSLESLGYRVGRISIMHIDDDQRNRLENDRKSAACLIEEKLDIGHEGVDIYG